MVIVGGEPASEQTLVYAIHAQPNRIAAVADAARSLLAGAPDAVLTVAPLEREKARYMLGTLERWSIYHHSTKQ